ncbi:hypothetical protein ACHAXT_009412 [Thalassiosira profunda]
MRSAILAAAIILASNPFNAHAEKTCACQPLGPPDSESHLVTRLWNIVGDGTSDQDVIDEFEAGFAPIVTQLDGFQRYTAATTGNSSTVFFMNAFDTAEHAMAAQEAAKAFVDGGKLKGLISPNTFTEDAAIYGFPLGTCIVEPSTGMFLSTRLFKWAEPEAIEVETLVAAGGSFNDKVKDLDGYITYVGTLSEEDSAMTFVYNIYDNEETSKMANTMGQSNAAENAVEVPPNELVVSTQGQIKFDFLCAAETEDPRPEAEPSESVEDPSSGARPISATATGIVALAVVFFGIV